MAIILNFNLVCVVCLQRKTELKNVFENSKIQEFSIADLISKCSELSLKNDNKRLPDKICLTCLRDLETSWHFRNNCSIANSVFATLKEENVDNLMEQIQKVRTQEHREIIDICSSTDYALNNNKAITETDNYESTIADEGEGEGDTDLESDAFDFDDYFAEEEVMDVTDDQISFEALESVESSSLHKSQSQENFIVKIEEDHCIKAESSDVTIKEELTDDIVSKNIQNDEEQPQKRRRGRPRKNAQISDGMEIKNSTSAQFKIKSEKENFKNRNEASERLASFKEREMSKNVTFIKSYCSISLAAGNKIKSKTSVSKPPKICEICGNSYKYQHALTSHMRRHTNDRPFTCEFCDKAYISGVELRRHIRVHTGQKPYACQYCERKFSDFGSRIKHERTHTGERPYSCSTCGKSFAYAHVLTVHLRTHTGEKKFRCERCGKGFTKKIYLQAHEQQHLRSDLMSTQVSPSDDEDKNAIKTVVLEECIFTTDFIVEEDMPKQECDGLDENMPEEHLEECDEGDFILAIR